MQNIELKVSGYRGIWGKNLTEEIAIKYAHAFGLFLKKEKTENHKIKILIGRDGRESGSSIANAIIPTLQKLNIETIYGDILPTPTIMFAVNHNKYDGAIIITASHNPIEYNGLKFVVDGGRMINEEEVEKIKKFLISQMEQNQENSNLIGAPEEQVMRANFPDSAKPTIISSKLIHEHVDFILKNIDVEKIRARKFRVAVDMINASACVIDPYMFEKLGIEYVSINDIPSGKFAHTPEPLKENLFDLEKLVKDNKCDIGFAQDPDADRLVIVDENGNCISEEYTLAFGIENILNKNPNSNIVINMSTSQMIEDIAEKYNSKCIRTKVGESNVFSGMKHTNAIAGGEGGGGVIYPKINNCRDSFVSIALTLELLANKNQSVSYLVESLPKYYMKKDKESVEGKNLNEIYEKLKKHFLDTKTNEEDGLRLDFIDKSWIHIRPSNTEPIIRIFGEAKTKERIDELFKEIKNIL